MKTENFIPPHGGYRKLLSYHLLDRQLRQLEPAFLDEGGLRERMTRARLEHRQRHAATHHPAHSRPK